VSVRVLVVGAGAAGLTAAIRAGAAGARVTVLNAHPKPGLKILMSGGTRCNVTHREVSERDFRGGSRPRIARVLRAFPADATRAWFEDELGVALRLEPTGKYFPGTGESRTVLEALLAAARRAGVALECGSRVTRLVRSGACWRAGTEPAATSSVFDAGVRAPGAADWELPAAEPTSWHDAERVILATGGLSYPRTGSDGCGYALARALGHTVTAPVPALAPFTAADVLCTAAQGVTLDVELSLWSGGRRQTGVQGSLVFAHFGVSGPAALDLSRHWQRAAEEDRRVTIKLLPGATRESLSEAWHVAAARQPTRGVRGFLAERLPDRIAALLATEAGLDGTALSQVPRERRNALAGALLERDLNVSGTLGFEKAEVTAGGVPLEEVDSRTLESRVAPGLFLCGEILDVDGRLGGFNFQWAWSSGTVAGKASARES
jgi:predicted Rossmann fold flavoprotein